MEGPFDAAARYLMKLRGDALWERVAEPQREKYRAKVRAVLALIDWGQNGIEGTLGRKREEGAFSAQNVQHVAVIAGQAIQLELCAQCSSPQQHVYHVNEEERHATAEPRTGTGRRGEG